MALLWSVLLLFVLGDCIAAKHGSDQFKDLQLQDPTTEFESEGGRLEAWRGSVLEAANVGACRTTLKPRGLWLPSYVDSPAMHLVTRGSGRVGIVPPFGDQRTQQTTFKMEKGDVVAVPEGVAIWWYNDGNKDMEIFGAADVTNSPTESGSLRAFHLAGGKQEGGRRKEGQQQGYGSVLHGFSIETLQRAWDMNEETVRRILQSQTGTGIIKVDEDIEFPEDSTSENSHAYATSFIYRFRGSHPDVRVQNGGELRELNSFKLPALRYMDLGMECMHLEKNAMVAPNWFHNAHQVLYVVEGRGKIEVVTNEGGKALESEVEQGSLVLIPSFYPSTKIASRDERFHYISVVTSHRPIISYLAGRNSVYQGIPQQVLSRVFNVEDKQASLIQRAREDQAIILPYEARKEKRAAW